ncbi:hypothetical protein KYB31_12400 [Clostridium felsineum]|uniref:hypothetical protein n=1 Tax=Clostridium felsineum TaxID=36839 RepID=UPI00214D752B|nr:hypothetical protein [Clostridium felsineum]MCR3759773.1 hypothetical protein [Clostridium felsineum]
MLDNIKDILKKKYASICGFGGVIALAVVKSLSSNDIRTFLIIGLIFVVLSTIFMFIKYKEIIIITTSIPLIGLCVFTYFLYYFHYKNGNSVMEWFFGCMFWLMMIYISILGYIRTKRSGDKKEIKKDKVITIVLIIFWVLIIIGWSYIML